MPIESECVRNVYLTYRRNPPRRPIVTANLNLQHCTERDRPIFQFARQKQKKVQSRSRAQQRVHQQQCKRNSQVNIILRMCHKYIQRIYTQQPTSCTGLLILRLSSSKLIGSRGSLIDLYTSRTGCESDIMAFDTVAAVPSPPPLPRPPPLSPPEELPLALALSCSCSDFLLLSISASCWSIAAAAVASSAESGGDDSAAIPRSSSGVSAVSVGGGGGGDRLTTVAFASSCLSSCSCKYTYIIYVQTYIACSRHDSNEQGRHTQQQYAGGYVSDGS